LNHFPCSSYLTKNNLLEPVMHAFRANGVRRDNLLNSAVIEMLEFIRRYPPPPHCAALRRTPPHSAVEPCWCTPNLMPIATGNWNFRSENIKSLLTYVVESFGDLFKGLDYVKTFQMLLLKHEQNKVCAMPRALSRRALVRAQLCCGRVCACRGALCLRRWSREAAWARVESRLREGCASVARR
jgi:hypothetical protein